jgi:cytochrome c-type biogenesis protein CcmH/NrfG
MQAYVLATICLIVGLLIGYLFRGSGMGPSDTAAMRQTPAAGVPPSVPGATPPTGAMQPTPEQMKQMADTQAAPLVARLLESEPNNADLLYKIGNIYYDAQQFPEAVTYYEKALKINPRQTDVRTDMGTAYYYMGQSDRALKEYDEVLKIDDKHANALFNQGMVRWQGKMDMEGAIASWERLLETNPNYPKEKRDRVQELIVKAQEHLTMKPGTKTDKPAEIAK